MNKSRNGRRSRRKGCVFLYGTLLPRLAPPEIEPAVRRLKLVGRGFVRGHLFDMGEYPGAILARNGPPIMGQVFEMPDSEILSQFDEFEGFDRSRPESSLFIRKRRLVQLAGGSKVSCWVYAYNGPLKAARAVAGGDYFKARALDAKDR